LPGSTNVVITGFDHFVITGLDLFRHHRA